MARLDHWNAGGSAGSNAHGSAQLRSSRSTRIDVRDTLAIDYWSQTLEVPPERIQEAVRKAGTLVEEVKRELGIAGV